MKKCLVIKNDGIGDLIGSSGVISQLTEIFPGGVDLITCKQNQEIAEAIPGLRKIIYLSSCNFVSTGHRSLEKHSEHPFWEEYSIPYSKEKSDYLVFLHLLTTKYDTAISLRRFINVSMAELMALTRADKKYCCWQFIIPFNLKEETVKDMSRTWTRIAPATGVMWETFYYQKFLETAFERTFQPDPKLTFPKQKNIAIPEGSLGLIITDRNNKSWPDDYWDQTINELLKWGRPLYVFGEGNTRLNIRNKYGGSNLFNDWCGKINLMEYPAYFAKMSAILAEGTGLTLLASLCRSKILMLQHGRDIGFFFPWGTQQFSSIIFYTLSCSGCTWKPYYSPCKTLPGEKVECIKRITPDKALHWFKKMVNNEPVPIQIELNGKYQ